MAIGKEISVFGGHIRCSHRRGRIPQESCLVTVRMNTQAEGRFAPLISAAAAIFRKISFQIAVVG